MSPYEESTGHVSCPDCGADVPVDPGYRPWCGKCGWNVVPLRDESRLTAYGRILERVATTSGRRFGATLFAEMKAVGAGPAPRSGLALLGWATAALVNAFGLAVAASGLALFGYGFVSALAFAPALVLLALAWGFRPRLPEKPIWIAPREQFPGLYQLADQVANALGAPPVHAIAFDGDYNASFRKLGWRGRSVVTIGVPLFAVLAPQERVALFGHELGHGVSGDPMRSLFVWSAVNILAELTDVLRPQSIWDPDPRIGGLVTAAWNLLMAGISLPVEWAAFGLFFLLRTSQQRAEYRADLLAAGVAGTEGMVGFLDRLHFGGTFQFTLERVAALGGKGDVVKELRRRIGEVPARELERIRRMERAEGSRLDDSHPATVFRLELLEARPATTAKVVLSEEAAGWLECELAMVPEHVKRRQLEAYMRSLYQ